MVVGELATEIVKLEDFQDVTQLHHNHLYDIKLDHNFSNLKYIQILKFTRFSQHQKETWATNQPTKEPVTLTPGIHYDKET